jgi:hypothetical protein
MTIKTLLLEIIMLDFIKVSKELSIKCVKAIARFYYKANARAVWRLNNRLIIRPQVSGSIAELGINRIGLCCQIGLGIE